jgi:hypothetical protein
VYLTCYAEGREGRWEAICVDLDLAVQGRSWQEVHDSLNWAIREHIKSALEEEPDQAKRLLNRRAPWHVRQGLKWRFLFHWLRSRPKSEAYGFTVPSPA